MSVLTYIDNFAPFDIARMNEQCAILRLFGNVIGGLLPCEISEIIMEISDISEIEIYDGTKVF